MQRTQALDPVFRLNFGLLNSVRHRSASTDTGLHRRSLRVWKLLLEVHLLLLLRYTSAAYDLRPWVRRRPNWPLATAAFAATNLRAWRTTRVNPIVALRGG